MKKIITKEQIEAVLQELYKLNIPVQVFSGIQEMFNKLPEVPTQKK